MYNVWRLNRINNSYASAEIIRADLNKVFQFNKSDLSYALHRLVREAKKQNGEDYPPNTVRELVIMIHMYLHECGQFWKPLDHDEFMNLCNVVDNTMKERHAMALGVCESAEIISLQNESKLFSDGVLGDDSVEKLLKTVIYMLGMHCALRGGIEHSKLR